MSNPRACDTMTGAFPGWSSPHRKCKRQANLGSLSASHPPRCDRTGRNVNVAGGCRDRTNHMGRRARRWCQQQKGAGMICKATLGGLLTIMVILSVSSFAVGQGKEDKGRQVSDYRVCMEFCLDNMKGAATAFGLMSDQSKFKYCNSECKSLANVSAE